MLSVHCLCSSSRKTFSFETFIVGSLLKDYAETIARSRLQFGINLRLGGRTSLRIINVQIGDKARLLYEFAKVSQRTPGPIGKDVIYSAVVQKIIGADSGGGGAEKHERTDIQYSTY